MSTTRRSELVRKLFSAYETKQRSVVEALLTDDFVFSSPFDDHIDRRTYFQRCWPNSEHIRSFDIRDLAEVGDRVFARYDCEPTSGARFQNTEVFRFVGDQIAEVEVYFGRTEQNRAANEVEIRDLLERWMKAMREKDVDAVLALQAEGLVMFSLAPPLQTDPTPEDARKALQDWFETWQGPLRYEMRELRITAAEDAAFCHSLNHLGGTKSDGQTSDLWLRSTVGLRKIDGQWKMTHQHESVPFYMDGSQKAALDLRPE